MKSANEGKKELTLEQKNLDMDLWIIAIVTGVVFMCYAMFSKELSAFMKNMDIPVLVRLMAVAGFQYGLAGLGITIVCIIRRLSFKNFGLVKTNSVKAIVGTVICFLPYILFRIISGQFVAYQPFSVLMTEEVLQSGFPISVIGMLIIAIAWGFFEGFNYAVMADIINKRYPSKKWWIDIGAIVCVIMCILFHPFSTSILGIIEILVNIVAIYGMLLVKKKTDNAWGCVFAFCFIWNAM